MSTTLKNTFLSAVYQFYKVCSRNTLKKHDTAKVIIIYPNICMSL